MLGVKMRRHSFCDRDLGSKGKLNLSKFKSNFFVHISDLDVIGVKMRRHSFFDIGEGGGGGSSFTPREVYF